MIVHLNGQLVPLEHAKISPLDRGFIFGDGIYEGMRSFAGKIRAPERHVARMRAGLDESRIAWNPANLGAMSLDLIRANNLPDAFIYWQVTRGTPGPNQPPRVRIPTGPMTPTVFGYCTPVPAIETFTTPPTIAMATRPDLRWHRGHLKSISLMAGVLSAIESAERGAADALLIRDGWLAEGTYANAIFALSDGRGGTEIATPPLDKPSILAGVTRAIELDACPDLVVRPIHERELSTATEIMLIGTTTMVTSVTTLDGRPVGTGTPHAGTPGPIARKLLRTLVESLCRDLDLPNPYRTPAPAHA